MVATSVAGVVTLVVPTAPVETAAVEDCPPNELDKVPGRLLAALAAAVAAEGAGAHGDEVEPDEDKVEPDEDKVEPDEDKVEPDEDKVEPEEVEIDAEEDEVDANVDEDDPVIIPTPRLKTSSTSASASPSTSSEGSLEAGFGDCLKVASAIVLCFCSTASILVGTGVDVTVAVSCTLFWRFDEVVIGFLVEREDVLAPDAARRLLAGAEAIGVAAATPFSGTSIEFAPEFDMGIAQQPIEVCILVNSTDA